MTKKQQRFCEEYLIDLNAAQAAIRAGYSPVRAKEQGYQLLHTPSLEREIARAMAERSKRTGVNADRVVRELARIAFVNPKDVISLVAGQVLETASPDDLACVASVKVKTTEFGGDDGGSSTEREVKLHDKIKALDMLLRHLGACDKQRADSEDEDSTGVIVLPPVAPELEPPPDDPDGGDGNG